MRRNTSVNLQHRRRQQWHRPAYLAPSVGRIQVTPQYDEHRLQKNDDYEGRHRHKFYRHKIINDDDDDDASEDDGNDNNEYYDTIDELQIPLFISVPHDDSLRFPVVSPPSSEGSSSGIYSLSLSKFQQKNQQQRQTPSGVSPEESFCMKFLYSVYYAVSDVFLLIFVCLMGLFFHVEVQVVEHNNSQQGRNNNNNYRRGRIIIQTHPEGVESNDIANKKSPNDGHKPHYRMQQEDGDYNEFNIDNDHQSTNLLSNQTTFTSSTPLSIDTIIDNNSRNSYPEWMSLGDDIV